MTRTKCLKAQKKKRLEARKKYYYSNVMAERKRAREFAERRKKEESSEARALRLARHREAQARYRKVNQRQLAINEYQRRRKAFLAREREADEEEFQRLMNAQDSDEES
ncbi:hypothetical protein BJ165DRAFT_1404901 [Panaeolus papilionaceus]|nr:hypothetical protein BJ165DRAFT_1404901 [Panaeolus papilionaceus]